MIPRTALEEQILRVLYEGPASVYECCLELQRYSGEPDIECAVERLLIELASGSLAGACSNAEGLRYAITAAGSERLAALVEARSIRGAA